MLEIKRWMVNYFKRVQNVFLVLDARKCWMKKSSTIQHDFFFFYEILDEIGAFKRIQRRTSPILYNEWNVGPF